MLPSAQITRVHSVRLSVAAVDGDEHQYLLRWTDETAVEALATFIGWAFHPEHPLSPCLAGSFISVLRSDDRVSWEDVKAAYKLAHQRQMAEAAAIVYGDVSIQDVPVSCPSDSAMGFTFTPPESLNTPNHVRAVDCGSAVGPALSDATSAVAVAGDQSQGRQVSEAPRVNRNRARVFLVGFIQAVAVGAAIAALIFSFAWGD